MLFQVLTHDSDILIKLARTIHHIHVLLDSRMLLPCRVIRIVFILSETNWVTTDPLITVHMLLLVPFSVEQELLNSVRLVLVWILKILLVDVLLLIGQEFGFKHLCLGSYDLKLLHPFPHFLIELLCNLFFVEVVVVFDLF